MKRLICLVLMLIGCGCNPSAKYDANVAVAGETIVQQIHYTKDPGTGLCFAYISAKSASAYAVVSITNVPCEKAFPAEKEE